MRYGTQHTEMPWVRFTFRGKENWKVLSKKVYSHLQKHLQERYDIFRTLASMPILFLKYLRKTLQGSILKSPLTLQLVDWKRERDARGRERLGREWMRKRLERHSLSSISLSFSSLSPSFSLPLPSLPLSQSPPLSLSPNLPPLSPVSLSLSLASLTQISTGFQDSSIYTELPGLKKLFLLLRSKQA